MTQAGRAVKPPSGHLTGVAARAARRAGLPPTPSKSTMAVMARAAAARGGPPPDQDPPSRAPKRLVLDPATGRPLWAPGDVASAASKAYGLLRTAGARTSVGAGLPTVPILPVTHPWVPLPEPAPRREPPPAPAPQPDARRSDDSAWAAAMSADPAKTVLAPKDEPAGMRAHRVEETAWLIALDKLKPQPRPQPAGPDAGPAADAARRLFRRGRVAYI